MSRPVSGARRRFQTAVTRAVGELGGDRAAEEASGVSKSVWYDAKRGRSVPGASTTWPAMRAVLLRIPAVKTGIRDWDALYEDVLAESGRPTRPAVRARPAASAPHQLPAGPGRFIAREAEGRALGRLLVRAEPPTVPIAVVVGPPGVGKTAFAVRWAGRAAREFPDGVLYADLRGWGPDRPMAADEVLPGWLRALGLDPTAVPDAVEDRAATLRTALEGRRLLVVLDNARTEEQVRPLLPGSPSCSVLVTSRQRMPGLSIHHGAHVVPLSPLGPQDSIALLREVAGERVEREPAPAARLADLCGRLPLALRIVAEIARSRPDASLGALADELADAGYRLNLLGSDDPRSDLRTVFSWSYAQLPADVAGTFRLLGLFPGTDLHPHAAAALAGVPKTDAALHLRALARMHLLHETATGRIDLHDLIRLYAAELAARYDSADDAADARRRLFDYYLHTAHRADECVEPLRYRLPLPERTAAATELHDLTHALAWWDAERANVVTLCALDDPASDAARWHLAFLARGYFFRAKRLHEWVSSHEHALAAAVRSGDHRAEAMTRSNLGLALHERGDDTGALPHYQAAERLFRELGDQHGVSNALAHQAAVLRRRSNFTESLRLNRLALEAYRQAGNLRNVAITLRGIALAEVELGRLNDAERHLAESLELCGQLGMDMDTARAGNTLGRVYLLAGRPAESERSFHAAMAADRASGGGFETALALRGLGAVAVSRGEHARAVQLWHEALRALEALGSPKAAEVRADLAALAAEAPGSAAAESGESAPGEAGPGGAEPDNADQPSS